MTDIFQEHLSGCSPVAPCLHCAIVQFLKGKLTDTDFARFVEIINGVEVPSLEKSSILRTRIQDMGFTVRILGGMEHAGIETLGDLIKKTEKDLLRLPNMGKGSVSAIRNTLSDIGLRLADKR